MSHWTLHINMSMRRFRIMLNSSLKDKAMKTSLQFLAEELVQEILQYLHWPTDFYNLSLVSRAFNRLSTHHLYSILVVGYHRPDRISALLAHLEMRPDLASLVTTLVFDEDVKCIGPKLLDPGRWPPRAHRRELADGWDPKSPDLSSSRSYPQNRLIETISRQLNMVIPTLPNIRCVIMRSLHPLYMHLGLPEKEPGPAATLTNSKSSFYDTVWTCLSKTSPSITELFVNGFIYRIPPTAMITSLTVVCISDLYYDVNNHIRQACRWNAVLVHALNLQTLGMIRVEYAYLILVARSFPCLEALELYKVFLGTPLEANPEILSQFLWRHSSTLHTLALSTHLCWSVNHCRWLSDKSILPKLRTLRLDDIFALLGLVATEDTNSASDIRAETTRLIISFVDHRPTILDIGVSSLDTAQADGFADYLARTRPMRNIFIGSKVIQSLNSLTSIARRYWDYSYEAWTFYQLFEGLKITKSGFRPRQPPQPWKFWKTSP